MRRKDNIKFFGKHARIIIIVILVPALLMCANCLCSCQKSPSERLADEFADAFMKEYGTNNNSTSYDYGTGLSNYSSSTSTGNVTSSPESDFDDPDSESESEPESIPQGDEMDGISIDDIADQNISLAITKVLSEIDEQEDISDINSRYFQAARPAGKSDTLASLYNGSVNTTVIIPPSNTIISQTPIFNYPGLDESQLLQAKILVVNNLGYATHQGEIIIDILPASIGYKIVGAVADSNIYNTNWDSLIGLWNGNFISTTETDPYDDGTKCYGGQATPMYMNVKSVDSQTGTALVDLGFIVHDHYSLDNAAPVTYGDTWNELTDVLVTLPEIETNGNGNSGEISVYKSEYISSFTDPSSGHDYQISMSFNSGKIMASIRCQIAILAPITDNFELIKAPI